MCRLLLYVGLARAEIMREILEALLKVATHDVIGTLSGVDENHPDGWGIYYLNITRGIKMLFKSSNAVFREEETYKRLVNIVLETCNRQDKCVLLAHVRAASEGEPLGVEHSHPYTYTSRRGIEVVFAHNGAVYKRDLADKLQVDPLNFTDSYIAGLYLTSCIDQGKSIEETLRELMQFYTKTALMTVTVLNKGNTVEVYVTSHVTEKYAHRISYYRLVRVDVDSEDTRIYMSSSIAYYLHVLDSNSRTCRFTATLLPTSMYIEHISLS